MNPLRITRFFQQYGLGILLLAVLSLAWILPSAGKFIAANQNDVGEWLPAGSQETQDLLWFGERFGSDEILAVSWPGCTLDDPRVPLFAKELAATTAKQKPVNHESAAVAAPVDPQTTAAAEPPDTSGRLFKQVFHGPDIFARLSAEELKLLPEEVRQRMSGWLLGPDLQTTCLVALISKTGEQHRHEAVEAVNQAALAVGVPLEELRVGGPTMDSVAIDRATMHYMAEMFLAACVMSILLAWFALRRFGMVLIVFGTAIYCELLILALMHAAGQHMDSVLIIVGPMMYVLGISGSIHFVNYYLEACRQRDPDTAVGLAVMESFAPCSLASITTAIGVGSLAVSTLVPIMKFGIFAGVGTMLTLGVLYTLLPAALALFHGRIAPQFDGTRQVTQRKANRLSLRRRLLEGWIHGVVRWNLLIVVVILLLLIVLGVEVLKIKTAVKLKSLFHPRAEVVQNYTWLEENLGPLVPVEVVLRFPLEGESAASEGDLSNSVDRLRLTAEVQEKLETIPDVGGSLSTATFSPTPPQGSGASSSAVRTVMKRTLARRRAEVLTTGYLAEQAGEELWRISARVPAMSDVDYGAFLKDIRQSVEQTLAASDSPAAKEAQVVICGGVPLFSSASKQLLADLKSSFETAFLLIGLSMCVLVTWAMAKVRHRTGEGLGSVVWRGFLGGAISMLPNIFPILVVFGVMGAFDWRVDIGAMMTASVALGIAVDDTLHFLTWFQRAMLRTNSRQRAVLMAFRHCGAAMIQTTLVCSLGLMAFAFSEFIPIARFSYMMGALLIAALIGDMLLLPALLVSPLGKVFGGRRK